MVKDFVQDLFFVFYIVIFFSQLELLVSKTKSI